jgi:ABC-type thiamin/hydroxymethylpyrimidine transport system permease subunit
MRPASVAFVMKDLKFLAIFVGWVVDIFGTLLFGFGMTIVLMIFFAAQGMPLKQITVQTNTAHLDQSLPILLASLGIGGFSTVVGGFVTGWMAKVSQLKNAVVMGLLSTLFGVVFWSFSPLWFNIVCTLITPAAAATGGYFAQCIFVPRRASGK